MYSSRVINHLTWCFEMIREQYRFVMSQTKTIASIPLICNDPLFEIAYKRLLKSHELFEVGLNNYRKLLKYGQICESKMGKVFSLYIKRSRFNIGLAWRDLKELTNLKYPLNNAVVQLNNNIKKLSLSFGDLYQAYVKGFLKSTERD